MKRGIFGGIGLIIIAVIGVLAYLSMFIVDQTQQALVLRFGQVIRPIAQPGLYYKLPLIDNVVYFDKRILDLDSPPLEVIASDQKRLVVDAWGRYKIVDPLRFYQSVGTIPVADSRLSVLLNSAVRQVLGDATFIQLVRDERADLMKRITERVDREATSLGIDVVDVRIRRADLPEANSQAIYQRMQTERQREATEIRALGEQQARRIRAEADRTATVIVAEAQQESERERGSGEARRNEIFAKAFGADPDFFAFYRSMQAYQQGLGGNSDTRLVISPDSEFFRFFNDATGLAMQPAPNVPPRADGAVAEPEPTAAAPAPDAAMDDAAVTAPDVVDGGATPATDGGNTIE
ncbi:MAG: protease modulator HflC [Bauldia sp.]|uniref:protease modulator HflC n=1 Tax=Bauldia sp. TaxID=2575872 RepID=UPI001D9FA872|nr:protease modulator HflC [Bauldia sp.]MCB1495796.1 protease modulator HflC [Bauldia sp.]